MEDRALRISMVAHHVVARPDFHGRHDLSTEIATTVREGERRGSRYRRGELRRILAVQLLGPLTMLAGLVWAVAQPYRIAFLHPEGRGLYDFVVQPPLLVFLVGIVYAVAIAPGLVDDLEREEDRAPAA